MTAVGLQALLGLSHRAWKNIAGECLLRGAASWIGQGWRRAAKEQMGEECNGIAYVDPPVGIRVHGTKAIDPAALEQSA